MIKTFLTIIATLVVFRIYFIVIEQKSLYYPMKDIPETPKRLDIPFEDVYFKTGDGQTLHGWFVPAQGAKITVLYCHGNGGNIYHRLHRVQFFHEMGVHFFIFDYRGYGQSSGRPSEKGLYRDAEAAYDYLLTRKEVDKNKIAVYGESLGGAVAAELALRRKTSALILEGSFVSVVLRAQQLYPLLPMKFLITQKYDTESRIKKISIPKLIAHARSDEVVGFEHGEMLYKAAAPPKQFLPFDGTHNDDTYVISPAYREQLQRFLTVQ